ncbi:hypothetical protein AAG747_13980 [Rapidithrix thailandica]|uniref:Uncharacterized protein n=1 Tax=Rapidithrix thailandica TaxID=413964 RepID=A0AAW9S9B6_9BACT
MFIVSESGNPKNFIQVPPLGLPKDAYVVDFYRSQEHADEQYGKADKGYDGAFGFDRYEKANVGEGNILEYTKLTSIQRQEKNFGSNYDYLCPHLSIWPPNVQGNYQNTKNIVDIVVNLEPGQGFHDKCGKQATAKLISSDPSIVTINGGADTSVTLKIESEKQRKQRRKAGIKLSLPTIRLECLKPFAKEVYITAMISNKEVGKLVLYPNEQRYIAIVQPVYLTFGAAKSHSKVPTSSIPDIREAQLKDYLNKKSLNQAFIYSEIASTTHQLTLLGADVQKYYTTESSGNKFMTSVDAQRKEFIKFVMGELARFLNPQRAIDRKGKEQAYKNNNVYQAMVDFVNEFTRLSGYNTQAHGTADELRAAQAAQANKSFKKAWNDPLINNGTNGKYDVFLQEERKMLNQMTQAGVSDLHGFPLKDDLHDAEPYKYVYVFYCPDLFAAYKAGGNPTDKVNGFTLNGDGITFMFSNGFGSVDEIVHEVAHGLGLSHTFDGQALGNGKIEDQRSREEVEAEIKQLDKKIDLLKDNIQSYQDKNQAMQALHYSLEEYHRYNTLGGRYRSCLAPITLQDFRGYSTFRQRIQDIQQLITQEDNIALVSIGGLNTDPAKEAAAWVTKESELEVEQNRLEQLKVEKKKVPKEKSKGKEVGLSLTQENYMDYAGTNSNFERKSLYKWQWDELRKEGSGKKFLLLLENI